MGLTQRCCLLIVMLFAAVACLAQQPLLSQLKPDLRVFPQFFSVAQGAQGDLYVGGTDGLLRFDGGRWRWYPMPMPGAVRVLHVDAGGRLWVGGNDCFGYMQRDATGDEHFVDLSRRFLAELGQRKFADIWRAAELDGEVYFGGLHDLFVVSSAGEPRRHWHHDGRYGGMAVVAGELWVQWRGQGLKKRVGDNFVLLPGGEQFATHLIYNLFELDGKRAFVHDIAPSLWRWQDNAFAPLPASLTSAELAQLGRGIRLRDGSLAFAGSNGVVTVLDADTGRVEPLKLSKNFIGSLVQAQDGGLFAVDPAAVVRLEWPQRWRMYSADQGVDTGIYRTAAIADALYLATWNGAYRAPISPQRELGRFELLPWTNHEAWAFHQHAGRILFADSRRLFQIRDDRAVATSGDDLYPRVFLDDPLEPRWLWVGTEHGPALFEQSADGYRLLHRDFRLGWSISSMVAFDGAIWAGGSRSGLVRLSRDGLDPRQFQFTQVGAESGLPINATESADISLLGDALWVSVSAGLFRYQRSRFNPDTMDGLAELIGDGELVSLRQAADGTQWAYSFHSVYRRQPGKDWQLSLLGGLNSGAISDLMPMHDGEAFVASESGLLQHRDEVRSAAIAKAAAPRVTSARVIRGPGQVAALALNTRPRFRLDGGSLEFDFGFPVFDGVGANDFQFRLEGHSPAWSEWSTRAAATFLALPAGDYRLRLRARRRFSAPVEGTAFEFVIVPRWYERAWVLPSAIVLVCALIALALIQRQRLKVRRLRAQNAELDRMVRERTRELESANVQLRSLADSDGLTGLANRRHFDGVLATTMMRARESGQPFALLMLDVDHFKRYNDSHGHQAGDDVLRAVATQMTESVRPDTLVARYGGEEFAVIAPNCDLPRAREIAERIRAKVAARLPGVTVSIGIAVQQPQVSGSIADLVAHADAALYRAKHNGRDRVVADDEKST